MDETASRAAELASMQHTEWATIILAVCAIGSFLLGIWLALAQLRGAKQHDATKVALDRIDRYDAIDMRAHRCQLANQLVAGGDVRASDWEPVLARIFHRPVDLWLAGPRIEGAFI